MTHPKCEVGISNQEYKRSLAADHNVEYARKQATAVVCEAIDKVAIKPVPPSKKVLEKQQVGRTNRNVGDIVVVGGGGVGITSAGRSIARRLATSLMVESLDK